MSPIAGRHEFSGPHGAVRRATLRESPTAEALPSVLEDAAEATHPAASRIGIFGNFGSSNLGNEATLEVFLETLRRVRPDAELVCVCRNPKAVEDRHGLHAVPLADTGFASPVVQRINRVTLGLPGRLRDLHRTWKTLQSLDVLVVPGTGILDDFGERARDMPLDVFKWSVSARLCGRPVALVSIGAGPIRKRLSRWLMKRAAALANYRSYRDQESKAFLSQLGVDTSDDAVFPDLVFAAAQPEEKLTDAHTRSDRLTVGLGVMEYKGWGHIETAGNAIRGRYLDTMTRFARWLLDCGYRVRLLIGSQSDRQAVEEVFRRLEAQLGPERTSADVINEPATTYRDVLQQVAGTDIVVAARFHNVVAALTAEKPVISLCYARKTQYLLQEMGLGAFHQDIEAIDVEVLIRQFEELLTRRDEARENIRRVCQSYRSALERQNATLFATIV